MKYLSIVLWISIACINGNAQKSSFTVRNNFFSSFSNSETIDIDTLIIKPEGTAKGKSYGFDLSYKHFLSDENGLTGRFGINRYSFSSNEKELIQNGLFGYREISIQQSSIGYSGAIGIFHQFYKYKKVSSSIGAEALFIFQPKRTDEIKIENYNVEKEYIGGNEITVGIPRTIGGGLNLITNLYYRLFGSFSIGLEANLQFLYENQKGNMFENPRIINENREVSDELNISHILNDNSFSRQFFLSFGVQYHF